jgi:hypothetical protein
MQSVLSSTVETLHVQHPAVIKSVLITNETAGGLELSIFRFQDTSGKPFLKIAAGADVTSQAIFNGIPFPDGFTVVPETGLTFYLIEYEPYKPENK